MPTRALHLVIVAAHLDADREFRCVLRQCKPLSTKFPGGVELLHRLWVDFRIARDDHALDAIHFTVGNFGIVLIDFRLNPLVVRRGEIFINEHRAACRRQRQRAVNVP